MIVLVIAWDSISSVGIRASVPAPAPGEEPVQEAASLEQVFDEEVARLRPIDLVAGIAAFRRRVCLSRSGGVLATGFLIRPRLVMTAANVFYVMGGEPDDIRAEFDSGIDVWQPTAVSPLSLGSPVAVDPGNAATAQPETYLESLDYAVLPSEEPIGNKSLGDGLIRGWFDLTAARERMRLGEDVFMLHHPPGGPMVLSEGAIGNIPSKEGCISHTCTTQDGSSGALLVNMTLRIFGLHESRERDSRVSSAVRADRISRDLCQRGVGLLSPG